VLDLDLADLEGRYFAVRRHRFERQGDRLARVRQRLVSGIALGDYGRIAGTVTVNPPSGSGSSRTVYRNDCATMPRFPAGSGAPRLAEALTHPVHDDGTRPLGRDAGAGWG